MSDAFEREVDVFDAARGLAAAERAAYLDQTCAGDAALRQRVEALLQASEQAGAFLQEPAPGAQRREDASAASTLVLNTAGEKAGDRIGRYKLLQQIGEGGCGLVYMAEQEEPVRRRVALKVIKLGMDTKSVIARFEAERQALAMMDHPNIAKVLDAGATETGRPYFVMELVRGIKITDYCDEHNLSTKERLDLFIQVCNAVQHAHQKGIIHRDLKPSNILVASDDGVAVPKVIDFGIAKATTGQHLTDKTVFTAFEQFIGTPAYMSPEQAELTMQDVDTRTDIYSLGVLLYELLTSRTPFDPKELLASGLDAMRRTIREQEPQRPSTRLGTMLAHELTTTAKNRHTEGVKLIHSLRGDLDWIVMKCLEKDRARRYETANGLARDIQHHLNFEPVAASPPGALYRLRKVAQRHRVAFLAVSAVVVTLVLGVIVSTWQAVRATRALSWARAETEGNDQVVEFLREMLKGINQAVAGRDTAMMQELVDKATARMEQKIPRRHRPEANLRSIIGRIYADLHIYDRAESMFTNALVAERQLHGNWHPDVARYLNALAGVLVEQGRLDEAEKAVKEAIEIGEKAGSDDLDQSRSLYANILMKKGKLSEAETYFRQVLESRLTKARHGPADFELLQAQNNLAAVFQGQGKLQEAEHIQQKVVTVAKTMPDLDKDSFIAWLRNLAVILYDRGKYSESAKILHECLKISQASLGPEHPMTIETMITLGGVLINLGEEAAAETILGQALTIEEKLKLNEDPLMGDALEAMAKALERQNKLPDAEMAAVKALTLREKLFGPQSLQVADSLEELGSLYKKQGKLDEAEKRARQSLDIRKMLVGPENLITSRSLNLLGIIHQAQRQFPEADTMFGKALTIRKKLLGPKHPKIATLLLDWADSFEDQGKLEDAENKITEALNMRTELFGSDDSATIQALDQLARLLARRKSYLKAEQRFHELLTAQESKLGPDDPSVAGTRDTFSGILLEQKKLQEAESVFRPALPIYRERLNSGDTNAIEVLSGFAWEILAENEKKTEAEQLLLEILSTEKRLHGDEHPIVAERLNDFANWQFKIRRRPEDAEVTFIKALSLRRKLPGNESAAVADSLTDMGQFYGDVRRWPEAEEKLRQALELETKRLGKSHLRVINLTFDFVKTLEKQEKYLEAETELRELYDFLSQRAKPEPSQMREAIDRLYHVYYSWALTAPNTGKMQKALEWKEKLAEFEEASRDVQARPK